MNYKEGSKEITKNIKIMPEEEIFLNLSDNEINITTQLVPNDNAIDFIQKLEMYKD